ncbi:MAG: hypothetical protein JOY71_19120 [Acetobacteraceae bacterium]|nr:hypothetical protein [Acetobacteraceae bacterium]MBV8524206.1 hypothetical protein [Acetobacteraceae bacterium]MBV8589271.1 hypothetical protein [Acetobacteraceae bacterium]
MSTVTALPALPRTKALRRVLFQTHDWKAVQDLLFLEAWEIAPAPGAAAALRVGQIRRANPVLAAEIRAELEANKCVAKALHQAGGGC